MAPIRVVGTSRRNPQYERILRPAARFLPAGDRRVVYASPAGPPLGGGGDARRSRAPHLHRASLDRPSGAYLI